ncbi:hypothetical protein FNV43_RR27312 [Rhamnella rubrinervis]|uniref:Uncharacterized protein n=1 Tax=Rhamnella rubrinervis TaxID=2594499 RepID=A0A8K0DK47_9ROSA|nr:hypothetical protein FNV43_RR27312 [Rhamnella rubrinervis]
MEDTFMSRHRVWSNLRVTIIMRSVVSPEEDENHEEDLEKDLEEFEDFLVFEDSPEPVDLEDEDPCDFPDSD